MKPVLGSLGANTLVILTPAESRQLREALEELCQHGGHTALKAFNSGIARGTAHMQAEFDALQKAKKQGRP